MSPRLLFPVLTVLAVSYTTAAMVGQDPSAEAARAFLDSLDEKQRAQACFEFDDAERLAWNFLPNVYRGVEIGDLDEAQAQRLDTLLNAHLSDIGREKLAGVRKLEEVLFARESRPGHPANHRDPDRYWVAVFGAPGEGEWGWRLQGHHLSFNFTVDEDGVAYAPFFLGANPRVADDLRLLGEEEALVRDLLGSLDPQRRKSAIGEAPIPRDVLLVPSRNAAPDPAGLRAADMDEEQVALLSSLRERLGSHLAEGVRSGGGATDLRFLWLGSTEPGEPHYWRVQSEEQVIEWCTPQGDAGHVHLVWRDLSRDLGGALREERPR
jgi:hypothetical protein